MNLTVPLLAAVLLANGTAASAQSPARAALPLGAPVAVDVAPLGTAFARLGLSAAETSAVAASPDVTIARSEVDRNRAALAQVRATLGPAGFANYAANPQQAASGIGTATQTLTTVGLQATIGDVLAYSPLVAQAAAALRASEFDERTAERTERAKVVTLYYAALKARAIFGARERALDAAKSTRDAAQKRFSAGDVPRLDVVRTDVAIARATADLAAARAADANATEALRIESATRVDLTPTRVEAIADDDTSVDPQVAVQRALLTRSDVRSARDAVAAEQAQLRATQRGAFPPLTLQGGYARGIDSGTIVAGPSLVANLTIPLGGAAAARVAQERQRLVQAEAKLTSAERALTIDVGSATRNTLAAHEARLAATQARSQAATEFFATVLGYRNGASSSFELTAARATFAQAQVDELSAIYDEAAARAMFHLATEAS